MNLTNIQSLCICLLFPSSCFHQVVVDKLGLQQDAELNPGSSSSRSDLGQVERIRFNNAKKPAAIQSHTQAEGFFEWLASSNNPNARRRKRQTVTNNVTLDNTTTETILDNTALGGTVTILTENITAVSSGQFMQNDTMTNASDKNGSEENSSNNDNNNSMRIRVSESHNNTTGGSLMEAAEDFVDATVSTAIDFINTFTDMGKNIFSTIQSSVSTFANATLSLVKFKGQSLKDQLNLTNIITNSTENDTSFSAVQKREASLGESENVLLEQTDTSNSKSSSSSSSNFKILDLNFRNITDSKEREGLFKKASSFVNKFLKDVSSGINRRLQT